MAEDESATQSAEAEEQSTTEAPSAEETQSTETDGAAQEQNTEETQDTDDNAESAESTETEGKEAGEKDEEPDDAAKAHNNEMAQRRIQERESRTKQLQDDQDAYVDDAGDDDQKRTLRELEVETYNNRVERNTEKLQTQYDRALADIDIFRNPSPEIKAELDASIDAFQAMHVKIDKYGNPVKITGNLHQFLTQRAESIKRLTQAGARGEKAAGAKAQSATLPAPGASQSRKTHGDDLKELWSS